MDKKMLTMTLAAAAAFAVASAPITSTLVQAKVAKVNCYGVNSCKGKSACKTAQNQCKGQNACKGKGYLMETKKQCKKLGGSLEEPKNS